MLHFRSEIKCASLYKISNSILKNTCKYKNSNKKEKQNINRKKTGECWGQGAGPFFVQKCVLRRFESLHLLRISSEWTIILTPLKCQQRSDISVRLLQAPKGAKVQSCVETIGQWCPLSDGHTWSHSGHSLAFSSFQFTLPCTAAVPWESELMERSTMKNIHPSKNHLNLNMQHWRPLLAKMWKGQKTVSHARKYHLYRKEGRYLLWPYLMQKTNIKTNKKWLYWVS